MRLRFDLRIIFVIAVVWLIYAFATGTGTDMRALFGGFGGHSVKAVVTQTTPETAADTEGEGGVSGAAMLWWGFVIAGSTAMLGGAVIVIGYALREFIVPSINDARHAADPAYQAARTIRQSYKHGRKAGMTHAEADGLYGVNAAKADVWRSKREAVDATVEAARARADLTHERVDAMRRKLLPAPPPEVVPLEPIMPPLTLQQAIEQSTSRAWIIGQAGSFQPVDGFREVGKLTTYDPRTSHAAILGASGTGKTASTGLLMALYARKFGLHPIVLDGKEGPDWEPLDGVVEWHPMNPATIAGQIAGIMDIFTERWDLLKSQGAKHIHALPADLRPVHIFLMIEEFGDIWMELKRLDGAAWKAMAGQVDRLFRLARATGITLCLIDQAPEKWTQQMRGNAKFVACYKLKGGVANAFSEYHADKLPDNALFSRDNVFYRPWHTEEEIDLSTLFAPLPYRLLGSYATVQPAQPKPAKRPQPPQRPTPEPVEGRRYIPAWEAPAPSPPAKSQALTDAETLYVAERKWDAFAAAWCAAYPTRLTLLQATGQPFTPEDGRTPPTPADLARAMAALHNERFPADRREWRASFYTHARRLFARYHKAGRPEAVEGVVEQIIRDEERERHVEAAKRVGAEVIYFNREELTKPKFLL